MSAADHAANSNQTSSYATASAAAAPTPPTRPAPIIPAATTAAVPGVTSQGGFPERPVDPQTTPSLPEAGMGGRSTGVVSGVEEGESSLREQVLLRLQAAGDGGQDTSMEVGLKVRWS